MSTKTEFDSHYARLFPRRIFKFESYHIELEIIVAATSGKNLCYALNSLPLRGSGRLISANEECLEEAVTHW